MTLARASSLPAVVDAIARPVLDLSGSKLRAALEEAIKCCEGQGGVERYIDALKLKSQVFQQALIAGAPDPIEMETLAGLCVFMPTVRRRIARYLTADGLQSIRAGLTVLLVAASDCAATDAALAAFVARFPDDAAHRWVRDFGAEVLHNVAPERIPLMTRWVWDARANTGALREIWFGPDVDRRTLAVADDYSTFLVLREELAVFLSDNGVFRDMTYFVDLLLAQVYAQYVCAQGGTYLRTDFSAPEDPTQHTRRMLGLDGVRAGSSRTRLKTIDGESYVLSTD